MRLYSGVAFLVKANIKVDFTPITSGVASLSLQLIGKKISLLGGCAPAEIAEDRQTKILLPINGKTYKALFVGCQHVMILSDFNCSIGLYAKPL